MGELALTAAKAQSSQGVSASRSASRPWRRTRCEGPAAHRDRRRRRGPRPPSRAATRSSWRPRPGLRVGSGDLGIDDLEADRGVGPGRRILGQEIDPGVRSTQPASTSKLASERASAPEAADPRPLQRVEIVLDASIEGVLMVAPSKMSRLTLPPLVMRNIFGIGQGGV